MLLIRTTGKLCCPSCLDCRDGKRRVSRIRGFCVYFSFDAVLHGLGTFVLVLRPARGGAEGLDWLVEQTNKQNDDFR